MAGPDTAIQAGTFYQLLAETERQQLHDAGAARTYRAGYLVTVEGKPTRDVTLVTDGIATAVCGTGLGAEMLLRIYGPGDIVGVEAVIDRRECPETVRALTACTALAFPAAGFAELSMSPGIAPAFAMAMARRAQAADEQARTRLAPYDVRLARALLELSARSGAQDGTVTIPVELSQETLGAWIGVSRATANRTLSALSKQGVLSTRYRKIAVIDPARLRRIAAGHTSAETDHW